MTNNEESNPPESSGTPGSGNGSSPLEAKPPPLPDAPPRASEIMVGVEGGAAPPPAVFSLDWFVGELATAARNGDTSLRRLCDSADRIAVAQERIAAMAEAAELRAVLRDGPGEPSSDAYTKMAERAYSTFVAPLIVETEGDNSDD